MVLVHSRWTGPGRGVLPVLFAFLIALPVGAIGLAFMRGIEKQKDAARAKANREVLRELGTALSVYRIDHGGYPAGGNAGMVQALAAPGPRKVAYFSFQKDRLREGQFLDVWDTPYGYERVDGDPSRPYRLWSCGPNRRDEQGGGDDMTVRAPTIIQSR